jgi:PncC family amidohydrolase
MEPLADSAAQFLESLKGRNLKLVTAESCTAGGLATLLSKIPGAGDTFFGGFVSYSKEFKEKILGVPSALIAHDTAVSDAVALAMARGAMERTGCDLALSVTGVAGPKPDEDGNPVGLVFVAVSHRDGRHKTAFQRLGVETPEAICTAAIREALAVGALLLRS